MKRTFGAYLWKEDDLYLARCVEVNVASYGETEDEALSMLKEALELYLSSPSVGELPTLKRVEVEVDAA